MEAADVSGAKEGRCSRSFLSRPSGLGGCAAGNAWLNGRILPLRRQHQVFGEELTHKVVSSSLSRTGAWWRAALEEPPDEHPPADERCSCSWSKEALSSVVVVATTPIALWKVWLIKQREKGKEANRMEESTCRGAYKLQGGLRRSSKKLDCSVGYGWDHNRLMTAIRASVCSGLPTEIRMKPDSSFLA